MLMPTGLPLAHRRRPRARPVSGGRRRGLPRAAESSPAPSSRAPAPGSLVLPSQVVMPWEAEVGHRLPARAPPAQPGLGEPARRRRPRLRERDRARPRASAPRSTRTELAGCRRPSARRATRSRRREEKALRAIEDDHLDEESERLQPRAQGALHELAAREDPAARERAVHGAQPERRVDRGLPRPARRDGGARR